MRCTALIIFAMVFITRVYPESSEVRRIIGGEDAVEEEYPYIVRLEYKTMVSGLIVVVSYQHACTSAVLSPTWSLTAAHCFIIRRTKLSKNINGKPLSIMIEPILVYGPLHNISSVNIFYHVTHPSFKIHTGVFNDIGLIKSEPIPIMKFARLSGIDFLSMIGHQVTLTGYGITNSTKGSKPISGPAKMMMKPLQKLDAVIVRCKRDLLVLNPGICVARRCGVISAACPGDSGGPLLHPSGVIGVNSIGPKDLEPFCFLKATPPIYDILAITPVSPFIDWISHTMQK